MENLIRNMCSLIEMQSICSSWCRWLTNEILSSFLFNTCDYAMLFVLVAYKVSPVTRAANDYKWKQQWVIVRLYKIPTVINTRAASVFIQPSRRAFSTRSESHNTRIIRPRFSNLFLFTLLAFSLRWVPRKLRDLLLLIEDLHKVSRSLSKLGSGQWEKKKGECFILFYDRDICWG